MRIRYFCDPVDCEEFVVYTEISPRVCHVKNIIPQESCRVVVLADKEFKENQLVVVFLPDETDGAQYHLHVFCYNDIYRGGLFNLGTVEYNDTLTATAAVQIAVEFLRKEGDFNEFFMTL